MEAVPAGARHKEEPLPAKGEDAKIKNKPQIPRFSAIVLKVVDRLVTCAVPVAPQS